jgi:hypothetical protein
MDSLLKMLPLFTGIVDPQFAESYPVNVIQAVTPFPILYDLCPAHETLLSDLPIRFTLPFAYLSDMAW